MKFVKTTPSRIAVCTCSIPSSRQAPAGRAAGSSPTRGAQRERAEGMQPGPALPSHLFHIGKGPGKLGRWVLCSQTGTLLPRHLSEGTAGSWCCLPTEFILMNSRNTILFYKPTLFSCYTSRAIGGIQKSEGLRRRECHKCEAVQ